MNEDSASCVVVGSVEPDTTPNCNPPKVFQRNEHGLLTDVNYIFDENGFINWRAMIPKEFLVPDRTKELKNKEREADETNPSNVAQMDDKDLIILLGGLKYLAQLRGFESVTYQPIIASDTYAAVKCRIRWIPNFETENRSLTFEAVAGATLRNTESFGQNYLLEMAENRAFCRCVRNALKIHIVSREELGGGARILEEEQNATSASLASPVHLLESLLREYGKTFEDLKKKMVIDKVEGADKFESAQDMPKLLLFEQIEALKSRLAERDTAKNR